MSAGRRPAASGSARPAARPAARGAGPARPVRSVRAGGRTTGAGARPAGREAAGAAAGAAARPAVRAPRPAPRPVRARRAVVLGGVLCVLAVLLAPALRSYLAQQQQVADLRAQVTAQRLQVQELRKERAAWDDDAYVKAQARERLKFVFPGERALTVIDPPAQPRAAAGATSDPRLRAERAARPDRAWFADMWSSVGEAGASTAGP